MDVIIRDWTFTHWWVRPVVKTWFTIYHKSVTYSGTEHIDWGKPIIFAPTHQNAFSDALCLILPTKYTSNRFIYPLIRADAFGNSKTVDWILTSFHMMPVYRPRDDVDLKHKNESVFSDCSQMLAQNRNLLIHAEGNCIPKKRVLGFKKGLARIAFAAEQAHDFTLGITVIPVGINYRQITKSRQGIHVRYGESIPVNDFRRQYLDHRATAITNLTRHVQQGVEEVTVNVTSDHYYFLSEDLFQLNKSLAVEKKKYSSSELQLNRKIARLLNRIDREDRNTGDEIIQQIATLNTILQQNKLSLYQSLVCPHSAAGLAMEGLIYLILSPLILCGWINNILPWSGIHKLADKVEETQFKSSAGMTAGLLFFPLCYLLQTSVAYSFTDSWVWSFLYLVSIPFTGILALNCWENFRDWKQKFRLYRLPDVEKQKMDRLVGEIFSKLL